MNGETRAGTYTFCEYEYVLDAKVGWPNPCASPSSIEVVAPVVSDIASPSDTKLNMLLLEVSDVEVPIEVEVAKRFSSALNAFTPEVALPVIVEMMFETESWPDGDEEEGPAAQIVPAQPY